MQGRSKRRKPLVKTPITVTIIAKDESEKIADCIASASWADEVLVLVDSATTDDTRERVTQLGGVLHEGPWEGFARQKNRAAELARNDWVLNLDADERVSVELAEELSSARLRGCCYSLARVSDFLGSWHRPVHRPAEERLVRLYDRTRASFNEHSLVHEKVECPDGNVDFGLRGPIEHRGFRSVDDVVRRLNEYSTLLALERVREGKRASLFLRPVLRLFWAGLRHKGILGGRKGMAYVTLWVMHDFLVGLKQYEAALRSPVER